MKKLLPVLLILAAGCSSGSAKATSPSPTPSPTPSLTGTAAFLAFAHTATFGSKDFFSTEDDPLLNLGNSACEGFSSNGLSYGRVVQGFVESNAHPSTAEAEAFVRAAVTDLCPEQSSNLP